MKKIFSIAFLASAFGMMLFQYMNMKGQFDGLKEKNLMVLAVACKHPDLKLQLENLDIPEEWKIAQVIKVKPELYAEIVNNIASECSNLNL